VFAKLFPRSLVPPEYRANFIHLYLDIGWFGVLSGSAVNFLNIYATRLGATGVQIGLIAAMSAIVNLLLAIPAGRWIERRHTGRAVFWASVFYRLGFLLWIPLPWLFSDQVQIWALIFITLLMAVPLTPLGVGFNALFAEAVPADWRAHVAGVRNIILAITFVLTSLISGYILNNLPFPMGYQFIFAIGAIGAGMSSLHIFFIRPLKAESPAPLPSIHSETAKENDPVQKLSSSLRLDIWQSPFRKVLLVLLGFHLAQFLPFPIFPLYNVRILNLNDSNIGTGTALFYLTVLIGSTQFGRLVKLIGHKKVTGWGVFGMGFYPFILAYTSKVWQFFLVSLLGGFMWALAGAAYANYLLENIPAHDRPAHLAWYNMALNAAILSGSLIGPTIATQIGLSSALIVFGLLRFIAGIAILKWG
jgi:MFS family permease